MSEDWDFYFCRVDDAPASIFVDLGIAEQAPVAGYVDMAHVRVHMNAPRDDGLSSVDEFDTLKAIEDALATLEADAQALYVGRNTTAGCRDFYFYVGAADGWDGRVAGVMQAFPGYRFETGTRSDPAWKAYFGFLRPSEEDRERIENRRTCALLEKNGDDLRQERPIQHWAYFPNVRSRDKFLADATKAGYAVEELLDPDSNNDEDADVQLAYGVVLSGLGRPTLDRIDDLTLPLFHAAKTHRGRYDGWETQVVG